MRAIAILNPAANYGLAAQQAIGLRDQLEHQLNVEWMETGYPMHAAELACTAARQGFRLVVAIGGDGTVNEVLNGLMRSGLEKQERPILGIIPMGSGNDFCASLRANRQAFTKTHPQGTVTEQWVDIGVAELDGYQRCFCLGIGIGFIGWANLQRLKISRRVRGHLGYLLASAAALLTYRPVPDVKLAFDKAPYRLTQKASMVMIQNSPSVGGGFKITPEASINDGEFDICTVECMARWQLAWLILQARSGSHTRSPKVRIIRACRTEITTSQPLPVHVDGEVLREMPEGIHQVTARVLPAEVRMAVLCLLPEEGIVNSHI